MKETFPIQGIDCVSCATIVKNKSLKMSGIQLCYVDVENRTVTYEYDENITSPKNIDKDLNKLGYNLVLANEKTIDDESDTITSVEHRNLMISIPLVIMGLIDMIWMIGAGQGWRDAMPEPLHKFFRNFLLASATIMLFVVGQKYLQAIRRYFRYGVVSMDSLVGLGTGVAYVYSFIVDSFSEPLSEYIDTSMVYYEAVVVVIGFISLGKYLEHRTMTKSGQAIKALLNLQAKKAIRINDDGTEIEVDVEELRAGNAIRIKSGEKVPLDCLIQTGSADIDESINKDSAKLASYEKNRSLGGEKG